MKLSLISVLAMDNLKLPGLLYEPEKPTAKVAIWLHGMGDSGIFYSPERVNALGQALTERGIALLAFNNRGAHNNKRLRRGGEQLLEMPAEDQTYQGGTHYELITDCVKDIDGAVAYLASLNFTTFYLLGHSTGANKICAYDSRAEDNPFRKYVLAGPGDDTGLLFQELGEKRFWQTLRYAAEFMKSEPLRVMPKYSGMYPFSVKSTWDILNPDGAYNTFPFYECTNERLGQKPLFEEYRKIKLPTLVIFGEADEYTLPTGGAAKALNICMEHTSNAMLKHIDFALVPGADHGFHGVETTFAQQVGDWLADD